MGRWLLIALLFLTVSVPAQAAPLPLARATGSWELVPAGEHVLVTEMREPTVRVLALPTAGGPPREVFSFSVPPGLRVLTTRLAASPQRAAFAIEMTRSVRDAIGTTLLFAGPLTGGWSLQAPFDEPRPVQRPLSVFNLQLDGERLFTGEWYDEFDARLVARDAEVREVPFASVFEAESARFAGDLVAYRARAAGESDEDRNNGNVLVLRNWRTGVVLRADDLLDDIGAVALHPDGRVAASVRGGALYELRPGERPRRVAGGSGGVAYAGDSLVYSARDGLRVVEPGGRIRPFGVRTADLRGFAVAGTRVVWRANGCVLAEDVSAPAAAAPTPGPCARSEVDLPTQTGPSLARTLSVALRCVAAEGACRGTLRLSTAADYEARREQAISRRTRFSIPAGSTRRVRVGLTEAGYRAARRNLERADRDPGSTRAVVIADVRTDDGERYPDETRADATLPLLPPRPPVTKDFPRAVQQIYTDYRRDGRIDVCKHSLQALKQALASIQPDFDTEYPDFRAGLQSAVKRRPQCGREP